MNSINFQDFKRESKGIEFALGYPLDEGETRASTAYSYNQEKATPDSVNATSLLQREEYDGESDTSMFSLSLIRDTRDDPRFPKSGHVSGAGLHFSGLGGQNRFARAELRSTWYRPVKKWLGFESTLVVNSRLGYAHPLNSIGDWDIPGCNDPACQGVVGAEVQPLTNIDTDLELTLTERYFLGGIGAFQMRGFKQYSLGPRRALIYANPFLQGADVTFTAVGRDPITGVCTQIQTGCNSINTTDIDDFKNLEQTDIVGGNKMFLTNFELRFPISEELGLSGILFFDVGNAFAENESIDPSDLRFSTGFGAQWFSPFGPVVAYMGFPLDPLEDEDGSVFEFSLGGGGY
jgi:outer membrane protein assembly factor BamA